MFGILGIIIGILLIMLGGFLVLFFPMAPEHQAGQFTKVGVILGFIFLIIGGVLVFM
jgi:hypothetical protein